MLEDMNHIKIANEAGLEEIVRIRNGAKLHNKQSKKDVQKKDANLRGMIEKLNQLKTLQKEEEEKQNKIFQQKQEPSSVGRNLNKYGIKAPDLKKAKEQAERNVLYRRVSNKDEEIFTELMKFYGQEELSDPNYSFLEFVEEFKMLRGEYGVKQNKSLNERLKPDIIKLHKEL